MNHHVLEFIDIHTHVYNYYKYFGLDVSCWFCTMPNPARSGFPGKPWLLFAFLWILMVQRQLIMGWSNQFNLEALQYPILFPRCFFLSTFGHRWTGLSEMPQILNFRMQVVLFRCSLINISTLKMKVRHEIFSFSFFWSRFPRVHPTWEVPDSQ